MSPRFCSFQGRCALVLMLLWCVVSSANAQYASTIRLTNPIGRTVLEVRTGTQPANARLVFTAAITAGPTGGTTSLLLHQMPIADLFNPVGRSSFEAPTDTVANCD